MFGIILLCASCFVSESCTGLQKPGCPLPSVQGITIIKNAQTPSGVRFLGGYYIRDTYLNAHFNLYGSNPELLEVSYRVIMYFARSLCLAKLLPSPVILRLYSQPGHSAHSLPFISNYQGKVKISN